MAGHASVLCASLAFATPLFLPHLGLQIRHRLLLAHCHTACTVFLPGTSYYDTSLATTFCPDVSVKLVKHATGIDCPLVTGPSSHQRVDRFQLVQVIIIECLFVGHVLHLLLDPLQALFCRLPKDPDDGAVSGSITAEDVLAQAIEAVNDVSDDGFLFA